MAEPILKLTRGVPKTDREWMDVFRNLTKFFRVSGDELHIGGDIVLPDQSVGTAEIEDLAITDVKLRISQGCSVIGRALETGGSPTDIQASLDGEYLRRSGNVLSFGAIADDDIPGTIARDVEVTAAIAAHAAESDPHPTYTTAAELSTAISNHEAAADPHPGYTTAAELASALSALNLAGSTYTPTLTNTTNLDASTAFETTYLRVGATVTVSGLVNMDPTSAAEVVMGMSLPVASNFASVWDCGGSAACIAVQQSAGIQADAANNRAEFRFIANDTSNRTFTFTFTYRII